MLAAAGGALGLFVAAGTAGLLIRLAFSGANYVPIDPAPSLPVLGFAFLLSVVTGVVFGIDRFFWHTHISVCSLCAASCTSQCYTQGADLGLRV